MRRITGFILTLLPVVGAGYTTYIGDGNSYKVTAMTTDSAGATYLTGARQLSLPDAEATPTSDVYVTKLDPSGNLLFTATVSGKGTDQANAIAVDPSGNIYVAGQTTSTDFPLTNAIQPKPTGAFIIKFTADGKTILYSTYFGGRLGGNNVNGITTDTKGNLYLTGFTEASDFPHTQGMPAGTVGTSLGITSGAFVAELSAAGDKILYAGVVSGSQAICTGSVSGCVGYPRSTGGTAIAVDAMGNAYVGGGTNTINLPTTPGGIGNTGSGAFVMKVNTGGAGLAYLTYLPGQYYTYQMPPTHVGAAYSTAVYSIAVDTSGSVYLAGSTFYPDFPTTPGAIQSTFGGGPLSGPYNIPPTDAFIAKLKPDASAFAWATLLGGTGADSANSIAVDANGSVWVSGTTSSSNFPNANGWSTGGDFLVNLNTSGTALVYSARYPNGGVSQAVALDSAGLVHTAGPNGIVSSIAPGQPATPTVFGITNAAGGSVSGIVAARELVSIYGPHIGPSPPVTGTFDSTGFLPKSLGGVQVFIGGVAAPLLYVSNSQINAVVPIGIGDQVSMTLTFGTFTTPAFNLQLGASVGIFRNPDGSAAAINEDGSLNSPSNPAKYGSIVTIWATGACLSSFADGQLATSASTFSTCNNPQIFITGGNATILYAGDAPGAVAGVTQFNFRLPTPVYGGLIRLTIPRGGSDSASLYVTP
jgi:uncharacterized protein (TIGR03437 family)